MVEILLDSIRADKSNNHDLQLSCASKMLPYFCSFNHSLYMKGVPLFLQDMLSLPEDVKREIKRMSSVKRVEGEFNGVGADLAMERTQNRSSALNGGWQSISTDEDAVRKWLILYPHKSAMHKLLLSFCKINDDSYDNDIDSFRHKEWGKSCMSQDDSDVKKIVDL